MTTFADQVYQLGGLPVGGALTQGKAIYVKPSSGLDSNDGLSLASAVKTLVRALAIATANQNDTVYLFAESNTAASTTDYQSATLDWNKDFVHLVGVNGGTMVGQRSRVAFASSYVTASNLFTLSADGCYIANIEFFAGVASANPLGAMLVTGTRNKVENCQISGIGDATMDTASGYSLKMTTPAAENIFKHCYIGLDTVIRATCKHEVWILGGSGTEIKRTIFEDCMFETYTSATDFKIIDATYIDRFLLFKNCTFNAVNGITSAVSPTGAIKNTTPNGRVLVQNSYVFGCDNVTTANDSGTLVAGTAPAVDAGLAGAVTIS
jgi:hypothetical protein